MSELTGKTTVPGIEIAPGVTIPTLGYGVFQIPGDETAQAVREALVAGYRSIDGAAIYGNEAAVGRAIRESGVDRSEIFVTSKVWNDDQGRDRTYRAFEASVQRLGTDYLDLYLIHWPAPARGLFVETWEALINLREQGRVRAIGVSNFNESHLARLVEETGVVPAINQVELHPYLQQEALRAVHATYGITTEAWGPLGQGSDLLGDPVLQGIAARSGATPAQVVLRWHLALGNVAIPKSLSPRRMRENLEAQRIELTLDDLALLAGLDRGGRLGPDPAEFG